MKRNLFGALAVAGALTLWTSVAGFADTLGDAKSLADQETGKVAACETTNLNLLAGIKTTSSDPEATQDAKDAIAAAKDEVKDIAMDARLDIASALADFKEATAEADQDEPAPSLKEFKGLVSGIREKACNDMTNVYTATQAEVKEILAESENAAAENDDHMNAAAEDKHLDRDKGEREREREREHAAEQERD